MEIKTQAHDAGKERMESVPKKELQALNDMTRSQAVPADGFSRGYSKSEKV